MRRAAQVMESQIGVRVVDRPLENLAVRLKDGGPGRFGLSHHVADGPLKRIALDRALDLRKQSEVPLRIRMARLLRKPDV